MLYQPEIDALWSNGAYWKNGQWNFLNVKNLANELLEMTPFKLRKMHFNSSGKLLGLGPGGLVTIDVENRLVEFITYNFNLIKRAFGIHIDKENRLWLGNADGIFQFKDSMLIHPGIEHPAFHSRVEDIDEFSDSSLVFGTKGWGAVIWKGKDFSIISEKEGLATNMIEDVHVDENGILWIGTLNGLNKVTFDQDNNPIIRQYTMANGLPSNEIYKIKSYKGQVWLCTAGGLVKFQEQPKNTVAKAPTIQKLVLNGKVIEKMSQTRFSYQENNFAFHFLTINYHQNGNINYRFRLNSKADWSYTQNLSVNYPQLSPGEYQFEVQAQNEDGFWSESTSYGFEIRPPWWATSWFISLLTMSFISSGFGLNIG